ncbi:MAG: four helix bundle suffix domain-containing protein, partial [Muribaculaceae bacterium]|nr:four helix bundle suffix domain-containing protein [Muribaculaceae bacterium]
MEDDRTKKARDYCKKNDDTFVFADKCRERSDETVANIMITQIRQLDAMLAKVLKKVEAEFINEGGIKESMNRARRQARGY